MKIKYLFVFLMLFEVLCSFSQIKKNDTTICLRVIGIAVHKTEPIDGVSIKLYKENEEMVWEEITSIPYHEHSFSFNLLGNSHYSILVEKPGFVTRLVSIDTRLPDEVVIGQNIFVFEFEVDLVKEIKVKDDFYMDFPIAIISYNKESAAFENHDDYTKHIKEKILLGIKGEGTVKK